MSVKCIKHKQTSATKKIKKYRTLEYANRVIEEYRISEYNFYDMESYLCENCGFYHNRKTNILITREQRNNAKAFIENIKKKI